MSEQSESKNLFYLYILRNQNNCLYIGQTNNLQRRLQDHRNNNGAKYIKDYGDFKLVYNEEFSTRAEAMQRERQIKRWTRAKKEALVSGDIVLLKKL